MDHKAHAKKLADEKADNEKRYGACHTACLSAYPKPVGKAEQVSEQVNLVQMLIDEKCATEDERDALLSATFEAVRALLCDCLCKAVADVAKTETKDSDSDSEEDGQVDSTGSPGLDLSPPTV